MKRFTLLLACTLLTFVTAFAQEATTSNTAAVITFEESSYDFGDIAQGDKVEHTFKFTNTGKTPLVLSNVQTTCGCTATNWKKEPIAPGESAAITASFNSTGKMGKQNKVITVYSNADNNPARVTIISNVLKKEDKAAAND